MRILETEDIQGRALCGVCFDPFSRRSQTAPSDAPRSQKEELHTLLRSCALRTMLLIFAIAAIAAVEGGRLQWIAQLGGLDQFLAAVIG